MLFSGHPNIFLFDPSGCIPKINTFLEEHFPVGQNTHSESSDGLFSLNYCVLPKIWMGRMNYNLLWSLCSIIHFFHRCFPLEWTVFSRTKTSSTTKRLVLVYSLWSQLIYQKLIASPFIYTRLFPKITPLVNTENTITKWHIAFIKGNLMTPEIFFLGSLLLLRYRASIFIMPISSTFQGKVPILSPHYGMMHSSQGKLFVLTHRFNIDKLLFYLFIFKFRLVNIWGHWRLMLFGLRILYLKTTCPSPDRKL